LLASATQWQRYNSGQQ
jgi:hypothetical protein